MLKIPGFLKPNTGLGELEEEFRRHFFKSDLEQVRVIIGFTVVAVTALSTIDYLLFQDSREFFTLLISRGLFILFSVVMSLMLAKVSTIKIFEGITLVWCLVLAFLTLYIDYNRPPDFTQNATLHIMMAFSAYVLIPTQPRMRMIPPILMTLGNLWIIFTVKEIPSTAWVGITVSAYFLLHLAGILTAVSTFNARREQFRLQHEQGLVKEKLLKLAIADELTGIYNRRYFLERAAEEFERHTRHGHPLTLMIADLDLLKQINDKYGHYAGDLAIRQFTSLIMREKRTTDIFGRLGGEEFGLLLPDTTLEKAKSVVNRIFDQRHLLVVRTADQDIHFSYTAGMAECRLGCQTLDDLFRSADRALYRGKENGRNRVEVE